MVIQLHRIAFIDNRIKQRRAYSAEHLAEELEVSLRTVKRDIDYLKTYFKAPIIYKRGEGYLYEEEYEVFEFFCEKTVLLKGMMVSLLRNNNYLPFATENIIQSFDSGLAKEVAAISDTIRYEVSEYENLDLAMFKVVNDSLLSKTCLTINYSDVNGEQTIRTIEPLRLIHYLGKWFLAAYCQTRKAFRIFLVSRISKISPTEQPISKQLSSANIDQQLEAGFGLSLTPETELATIRLYEPARTILKNVQWHKQQTTTEGSNQHGTYRDITLPISRYDEIIGRALRYAPHAEILSPPTLRHQWLTRLQESVKRYK